MIFFFGKGKYYCPKKISLKELSFSGWKVLISPRDVHTRINIDPPWIHPGKILTSATWNTTVGEKVEADRKTERTAWSSWGLIYEPASIAGPGKIKRTKSGSNGHRPILRRVIDNVYMTGRGRGEKGHRRGSSKDTVGHSATDHRHTNPESAGHLLLSSPSSSSDLLSSTAMDPWDSTDVWMR